MVTKTAIRKSVETTGEWKKASALYATSKAKEIWADLYQLFVVLSLLLQFFYIVSTICSRFGKKIFPNKGKKRPQRLFWVIFSRVNKILYIADISIFYIVTELAKTEALWQRCNNIVLDVITRLWQGLKWEFWWLQSLKLSQRRTTTLLQR